MVYVSVIDEGGLQHHGILGMKWGKRNGPPYPLGAGDHSASENKAGWRKSLAGGGHRALAKVYEVNEKYYSKNNRNKALATANRSAKEAQLKKAEAAKKVAEERKANRTPMNENLKKDLTSVGKSAATTAIAAGVSVAAGLITAYAGTNMPLDNEDLALGIMAAGAILKFSGDAVRVGGTISTASRAGVVFRNAIRGEYADDKKKK